MSKAKNHVQTTGKSTYHMGPAGSNQEAWDPHTAKSGTLRSVKETITELRSALRGKK